MNLMKLLYRITIAIIGIVFITGLILVSYSLSIQYTLITSQIEKKGTVLTGLLSSSTTSHIISHDYYTIKLLFEPLQLDNDIVSVSLIGPDNFIKMHSEPSKIGMLSEYQFDRNDFEEKGVIKKEILSEGHRQYMFFSPVKIDHYRNGLIQIILSDKESLLLIKSFERKILLLTAVVLLGGIIAAYLISRQISSPIIELTEDIKRFLMKRPQNIIGRNSADEITVLKQTFKFMMTEIQNSIEFRVKNEKMAVLGHLSAVLAHEIKNPLEPIKGSAELLKLKYPENEDIIKYCLIIQSEVSELILFLDSFLDVAKSSDIIMKRINVNKALRDMLLLLEYTLSTEKIKIDLQLQNGLSYINGDSGMIKQVFLNLFLNAIQAKKGDSGLIELSTSSDNDFVKILIKDYGIGVDPTIENEIFQPFFTTKDDGSGIGLSTSRHILNRHSGTITLNSETHLWTEVRIKLPIYKEVEENA